MIEFKDVSHDWGSFSLKNITFSVKRGEYFVILGPTGAGKTLILETIAGFYIPKRGKILLKGKDSINILPEERGVGFVYQDYALFPHMNVEENTRFGLDMRKLPSEEAAERVLSTLELLGIKHLRRRYPRTLSGGELQRVAIARALVIEPDIMLLDEPLSALDTKTKENLRKEIKHIHQAKGTTTIHVTHDQTEALLLSDRIAVIIDGEIAQIGPSEKVFNKPTSLNVANFVGTENMIKGEVIESFEDVACVDCGRFQINVISEIDKGKVYAFIRPENIILSRTSVDTSARNILESRVTDIVKLGSIYQIQMDTGLSAVITLQSLEDFRLEVGSTVYASFKATAAHLIQRI